MTPVIKRLSILLAVIAVLVIACVVFFPDFSAVKDTVLSLYSTARQHFLVTLLVLLALNIVSQMLALPAKTVLSLSAGALIGYLPGAAVTLTGVIAGSAVLFATVRWTGFSLPGKFRPESLGSRIVERIRARPIRAVMGLRLVLTLPYPAITVGAAAAGIKLRHFIIGSLIGDAPVVVIYNIAGERLRQLAAPSDAISVNEIIILSAAAIVLIASVFFRMKKKKA